MVQSVTIPASNSGSTLEEQAAAQEAAAAEANKAPELAGEEGGTDERPEWLPEKFKSPEEMAKAYSELEKKQSQGGEEQAEADEAAEKAVSEAGLDMEALSAEWTTNGELSAESYEKLEAAGINREMVEMYAAGIEATAAATEAELLEPLGGDKEAYDELVTWAANEMSEAEIDSFNTVLETGNTAAIKLAVKNLADKHAAANGYEPGTTLQGKASSGGVSTYESVADLTKDMQNPEYARNPAFRAKVEAKLARSSIL